jgi:hypothetical protein
MQSLRYSSVFVILIGSLVLMSGMAMASGEVASPDGGARLKYYSSQNKFALEDTKCDAHPVFALYRINDGSEQRHNFSGGCHNGASWTITGTGRVSYRVCTNIQRRPDSCSGWLRGDSL